MLTSSVMKTAAAALAVSAGLALTAPKAHAHVWYGGGWGPGFVVRVGPPAYYGPRPYYYGPRPYYYGPGAYYARRPYYYGYRPYYYYHPHPYYAAPVIGFGITVR